VKWVNAIPVDKTEEIERVENGSLTDSGLMLIAFNNKLQPGPTGKLHLGLQA